MYDVKADPVFEQILLSVGEKIQEKFRDPCFRGTEASKLLTESLKKQFHEALKQEDLDLVKRIVKMIKFSEEKIIVVWHSFYSEYMLYSRYFDEKGILRGKPDFSKIIKIRTPVGLEYDKDCALRKNTGKPFGIFMMLRKIETIENESQKINNNVITT